MLRAALIESHAKTGRFNEPVASAMVAAIGAAIREVREDAHLGDVDERTRYEMTRRRDSDWHVRR
jgi:hypothetical protein